MALYYYNGAVFPISLDSTLIELENKIERGLYSKTKRDILELKNTEISKNEFLHLDILLCRIFRETGEIQEASSLSEQILESVMLLKDENLSINALLENSYCLWYTGNYEKGIEICKTAQDIITNSDRDVQKLLARSQIILGNLTGDLGDLDLCLIYYTEALKIYSTLNDKDGIAYALNNLGAVNSSIGNLDEALICYEKSGEIFKEFDNSLNIGMSIGNIGDIYLMKGDLDTALEYLLKSHKIFDVAQNKLYLQDIKASIGMVYYAKGSFQDAIVYFEESLALYEKLDNILWVSATYLYYILTYCEIDINQAENLLTKYQVIVEADLSNSKIIDLQYKLANSIVLIKTNRLKNLVSAQTILYQIVDSEEIVDYTCTIMAMKYLAELLIMELKLFNDENILDDLTNLISKLNNNALSHGSHQTQVQSYILSAKLKLLSGKMKIALEILNRAELIAKENGLEKLLKEVLFEKEQIVSIAYNFENSHGNLTGIKEKLLQVNVESYLNEILTTGILQNKKGNLKQ